MAFICSECNKGFIKPKKKIVHDGVITREVCVCPNCDSLLLIENIKNIAGYGDMKKWIWNIKAGGWIRNG